MVKKVIMKNLVCTGCAASIEKELVKQLGYVHSASFNFASQTMLLEVDEDYDEASAIEEIQNIVDSVESGVDVFPYEQRNTVKTKTFIKTYRYVLIGALIYVIGALFGHFEILRPRLNVLYWIGYMLLAHKIIHNAYLGLKRSDFFNENTLMFIATFAAMLIEKPYEAALVIVFYSIGEHLQHRAVEQSKNEISSLMDLHVDYANVIENGDVRIKDPMSVQVGDRLVVKKGEKIPADGVIVKGRSTFNTSALTGESKLREAEEGDYILSGNINVGEVIELKAEKEYSDSTIARIIDIIENATNKKAKTENFITRFARYYTPVVTALAFLIFLIPTLIQPAQAEEYIFRAAIFLVISCPCALVLSIPLSYFAGIGASAKEGILFKGSNYLDMLNDVDTIGIDKTGTLTHGNFEVAGFTSLKTLKLAASVEKYSNHPIASSIIEAYPGEMETFESIEEMAGMGIKASDETREILVGNRKLLEEHGIEGIEKKDAAGTNIFVAENGTYIGRVVVKDQIRDTSRSVMKRLKQKAHITMLTGDNEATASEVAYDVGNIGYAHNLMPEDKIHIFNALPSEGRKVYVGDGINDAPLIRNADVGIAMGEGSELAIDVADVIIMNNDLSLLEKAFHISKRTRRIVYQNITISLGVKFLFLLLAGFGATTMLMAIFADVGITLIAVLNALRLIYRRKKTYGENR